MTDGEAESGAGAREDVLGGDGCGWVDGWVDGWMERELEVCCFVFVVVVEVVVMLWEVGGGL